MKHLIKNRSWPPSIKATVFLVLFITLVTMAVASAYGLTYVVLIMLDEYSVFNLVVIGGTWIIFTLLILLVIDLWIALREDYSEVKELKETPSGIQYSDVAEEK